MSVERKGKKSHGGRRAGSGKPPLAPDEKTIRYPFCMTESQKAQLMRLGGAAWIRKQIDRTFPAIAAEGDLESRLQAMSRETAVDMALRLLDELENLKMQGEPEVAEGWICIPEEIWNQSMERVFGKDWWVRK